MSLSGSGEHVVDRGVQDAFAGEPVVVVTEAVDAILLRGADLVAPGFTHAQIVEAEVGRANGAGSVRRTASPPSSRWSIP